MELLKRLRRNREHPAIRNLVRETRLCRSDLVAPFFIIEGENRREPIPSLPYCERLSIDQLLIQAHQLSHLGCQALALFPVIAPSLKDPLGLEASNPDGLIIRAIRALKKELPSLCLFADVALDPYTSHGHDGLTDGEKILNDPTIERLIEQSLCLAQSGADFLAPSDMMDGRIGAIRKALDQAGFSSTGLLAYSAKYASSLYGPFRDAVGSHLAFGDKKTYQMDPANVREALLEAALDEEEGADILMIKPALFYLDVIAQLRQNTYRPIAAYHVSGEYAMAFTPSLNPQAILREALLAIKRAGANLIFTYATPLLLPHLPF